MQNKLIAIVPAAGVGQRAQSAPDEPLPKQYRPLKGEPMLRVAVRALLAEPRISQVRVAVAPGDRWAAQALQGLPRTIWRPCGGPSRAATVQAALRDAGLDEGGWVLVHDAARPGLPADALARLVDACLERQAGGLLAVPVPDTVKQAAWADVPAPEACILTGGSGARAPQQACVARATLPRDALWLAQTPQMFPAGALARALAQAQAAGVEVTDEASAMEAAGCMPLLVPGSARNFKVTWPEDFDLMEKWL